MQALLFTKIFRGNLQKIPKSSRIPLRWIASLLASASDLNSASAVGVAKVFWPLQPQLIAQDDSLNLKQKHEVLLEHYELRALAAKQISGLLDRAK